MRGEKENKLEVKYGLPFRVQFCKKCIISNQRPVPSVEFRYQKNSKKDAIFFDSQGICQACRYAEAKAQTINWKSRYEELAALCDKHRSKAGDYDCIVPGSGGKDSVMAAYILKSKFGMHPLTVTWAPHIYTEIGWKNFQKWMMAGYDNILFTPNGKIHRLLTRLAFENLLHPFQPFVFGQRFLGLRIALKYNIPLVFHGESPWEYGSANLKESTEKGFRKEYFTYERDKSTVYLGGISTKELVAKHRVTWSDLQPYLPLMKNELETFPLKYQFLGYYIPWDPQEAYYCAVEQTGFEVNPERTEGTYSKYASLDDRIDGFHYYTSFIKFGLGRATMDAAQEIRNGKITRDEGVSLVKKYDGEFPAKYFQEVLEYMNISKDKFYKLIDQGRSPHLWKKHKGKWILRHAVYKNQKE